MARWIRWMPALGVVVLLAACGSDASQNPMAPSGARFNGGWTIGGNATDTTTVPPPENGAATTGDGSVPEDSTSRGGWTIGGN